MDLCLYKNVTSANACPGSLAPFLDITVWYPLAVERSQGTCSVSDVPRHNNSSGHIYLPHLQKQQERSVAN